MIQEERIRNLNNKRRIKGKYVLYWMQAAQRAEYNHALEYSIRIANKHKLPVVVLFGITDSYPEANLRHYYFVLEGLYTTSILSSTVMFPAAAMVVACTHHSVSPGNL